MNSIKANRILNKNTATQGEQRFDFVQIALRHKLLVALGVVVAVIIGAFYYARATPIYQSSAEILIINTRPETVAGGSVSYFSDYMSMHQALIISPAIVNRASERADVVGLNTKSIHRGLSVGAGAKGQNANNILTLSFQGEMPEECPLIVSAVLETYQDFLEETYASMSDATVRLMEESCKSLLEDLKTQEDEYRQFREEAPLILRAEDGVSPALGRLTTIQAQQSQLLLQQIELESQLKSIEKAKEAGRSPEFMADLISNLDLGAVSPENKLGASKSERLDALLFPLLEEESKLRQYFGANHPSLNSVQIRIARARDFFNRQEQAKLENGSVTVQSYVDFLTQELDRIATSQQIFDSLYETEQEIAKGFTNYELREKEFERNMSRTQQLYDGVIAQLQEAHLSKDYGGFKADVISPPQFGERIKPNLFFVLNTSLIIGLILGMSLATLADISNDSFHSSDEVKSKLGLQIVGQIPQFQARPRVPSDEASTNAVLDPCLYAYHWPRSIETEAYRSLRTGLYFTNRGMRQKVIQVTSASPGDGKSTVASNLSVCIAQSGKRVLLIDADMRLPRLQRIFNVESQSGLSTLLAHGEELEDTIQQTAVENLWLLPAGPLPPDPAELLTSSIFADLIKVVRDQYDYVIIDTGPVLAISDPRIVSSQVDGVLLAVWLNKTKRKQIEQANYILGSLSAPVIGVVVNAVSGGEAKKYGYGYGDYHKNGNGAALTTQKQLTANARS